jgi:pimeloyl-ACP methyl ester carboxylesterase
MFDNPAMKKALLKELWPLLKFFVSGNNRGLGAAIGRILDAAMGSHYFNADGSRSRKDLVFEAERYDYSLAVAATKENSLHKYRQDGLYKYGGGGPTQLDYINSQINVREYCELVGYENVYYFTYESFGDPYKTAEELYDYVENIVKPQTGADKVNLVFISLGGTIGTAYFDLYADSPHMDSVHKIIFANSALDGSYLLSDILYADFNLYDKDFICTKLLPDLFKMNYGMSKSYDWLGQMLGIFLRLLPEKWFYSLVDSVAEGMRASIGEKLVGNCPMMWALVPNAEYEALSKDYLKDEAHAPLKEKTDRFYEAQSENSSTIPKLVKNKGTNIFAVCGYNLPLPSPAGSYSMSSDFVIHAASQSLGGTFAPYGQKLSKEYIENLADKSYLSPDKNADLGTSWIKDNVFLIKGQSHLDLQRGLDSVIHLCVQIAFDDNITDARINNGGFPQFNEFRDTAPIRSMLNDVFENADFIADHPMEADLAAEFFALRDEAHELLAQRVWDAAKTDALTNKMADFLEENFGLKKDLWPTSKQVRAKETASGVFGFLNRVTQLFFNL